MPKQNPMNLEPLIKTLFQKDTIRRVMAHAMHIMEQSKAGKC